MRMINLRTCLLACFAVLVLAAHPVSAQDNAPARPLSNNLTMTSIPTATIAPRGLVFGALSGTTRIEESGDRVDGSAAIGAGFGDAQAWLGFQVTANITSLTDNFADSGYLSFKVARDFAFTRYPTFASLSFGQLANWGEADGEPITTTVTWTHIRPVILGGTVYPVMFSAGASTHIRNNQEDPGAFAGIGIGVTPSFGLSAATFGDRSSIGASFRIKSLPNARLAVSVEDVFDQQDSQRVNFTLSYALRDLF